MVLLTVTTAAKAAIDEYVAFSATQDTSNDLKQRLEDVAIGSPVEHSDLIDVSKCLIAKTRSEASVSTFPPSEWRLDTLLKGAEVYRAPPPPKPEPVSTMLAMTRRCMITLVPVARIQSSHAKTSSARRTATVRAHDKSSP